MHTLPPTRLQLLAPFAPRFSRRVWQHALGSLAGTILVPGQRTVTASLRAVGVARDRRLERYHRVLNRDRWSGPALGRVLRLLVAALVRDGPIVVGVDETIERRRGATIAAKGIYRDAVRSSQSHFVKTSGLRWIRLMLLVPIPGTAASGPCRSSPAWHPRYATIESTGGGTRRKRTGRGSCCGCSAAGSPPADRGHRRRGRQHLRRYRVPGGLPLLGRVLREGR